MGKDSAYLKQLDYNKRLKLQEILSELPIYTRDFLDQKAERNPNTAVAYARDLMYFFEYLKEFCPAAKDYAIKDIPIELLEELSYRDINEYMKFLDIKHPEYSTDDYQFENNKKAIQRKMCALRGFFKYECAHEEMRHNPTQGANSTKPDPESNEIIRLSPDEVHAFLLLIQNSDVKSETQKKLLQNTQLRDYAILYLLLHTGIRVSECVALDLNDLDFTQNSMRIFRKGHKEQVLYFDDEVAGVLLEYIEIERPRYIFNEEEPALFMSLKKNRMAVRSMEAMVKKYADAYGFNKKVTPHKMRSTYGTALYNQTGDIRLVADVLGHNDINTTAKHYAATAEERLRAAAKINPY